MTTDFENISVFSMKKSNNRKKFNVINIENADSDILNVLGVKNSSVFLSNCTIWVEGITDRIYLRKFLEVYMKSISENLLKEDIHFSFVEYGGGNITHWSFLNDSDVDSPNINVQRLCGKLFLVSDSDGVGLKVNDSKISSKRKKSERHKELKRKLGCRYYCLEAREIENTLSPNILKQTIKLFEKENFENIKFTNWTYNNYKDKPLGIFINKNASNLIRKYDTSSGTINEKLKFAKRAVKCISSVDDLTDDVITLCELIVDFIKKENFL